MDVDRDRARGALMGLAVGDALGTTLEFSVPRASPFPDRATGPHREIRGGGPFDLAPGQVTDDTQMACCLAASLVRHRRFDAEDVASRYVGWLPHAFDVGGQTRAALGAIQRGADPLVAGRDVWLASGQHAAGNGSLMRTAPIGVFFARDPEGRRLAAAADSAITHFDPRCVETCVAFDAAIATAVTSEGGASPRAIWEAARAVVQLEPLCADLEAARLDDPGLYSDDLHLHRHQGFVRVALRLAFWELMHAPSFEAALVDVVNRGGDADTNGAITGALLGAAFGESAIPISWRTRVLEAAPLRPEYHPRVLLEVVG